MSEDQQDPKPRFGPLWQVLVFSGVTMLAFMVLVRTPLVTRFAYLVERGRIEALREALPDAEAINDLNAPARFVAAVVAPAVVQVITERTFIPADHPPVPGWPNTGDSGTSGVAIPEDEAHQRFRDGFRYRSGYGSGFIIDADAGLVVTNHHVIDEAETILVYLADGRRFEAVPRGTDAKTDLAVLHIDADNLHALPLAEHDTVQVGDDVMAVGNPFGLDGTFSRGIISAKGRSTVPIDGVEYKGFLQTDAVINPGNSGGPLVNMRGEVIAINTAIATDDGVYAGVGFAIPVRRIRQLLPALARGEAIIRGYLGVSIANVEDRTEFAEALGWRQYHGVIVNAVLPDTPAALCGLRPEDIITHINGEKIRHTADLIDTVGETLPGSTLALTIWRDGDADQLTATITRQPENFSTVLPLPSRE